MLKNTTYQEKFQMLNEWMGLIIESVKRDIKNEHLKKDGNFLKKYLAGKNLNKLTTEDLVQAYSAAISGEENGESIGEFVSSRWLLKHGDIYSFFEDQLTKITADFSSIHELTMDQSKPIIEEGIKSFGAPLIYQFSVMNSVVFPEEIFTQLRKKAQEEAKHNTEQEVQLKEHLQLEDLKKTHERDILRLTDKYEKKLGGLQKKYVTDIEGLRKQIAQLQRKLTEK